MTMAASESCGKKQESTQYKKTEIELQFREDALPV